MLARSLYREVPATAYYEVVVLVKICKNKVSILWVAGCMLIVFQKLMARHLRCPMLDITMCRMTINSLRFCCTPSNSTHVEKTQEINSVKVDKKFVPVAK
jgi:hypothetical protein